MTRHFHKALVEAEVVADAVLPALLVLAVIREVLHDVFVDAVECQSFLWTLSDGQHDERVVRITRLLIGLLSISFLLLITGAAGLTILQRLIFIAACLVAVVCVVVVDLRRRRASHVQVRFCVGEIIWLRSDGCVTRRR